MPTSSFFNPDEALEQGKSALNNQVQTTIRTVKGQVTGQPVSASADGSGTSLGGQDALTKDFIQDLYAPSQSTPKPQTAQSGSTALPQSGADDEQAKLAEARRRLDEHTKQHMESYYRPTFENRPQQEERAAEKIEREEAEEKQKRWELAEKEQKESPIALKMATNKAEMFRGASG